MKFTLLIVLFSVFVAVLGRPADDEDAGFEGSDRTSQDASAVLVDAGTDKPHYAVQGSYKYVLPEGRTVEVSYKADENGFKPEGEIIHSAIVGGARVLAGPFLAGAKAVKSGF